MKQIKMIMLVIALLNFLSISRAQMRVQIGDLYYNISGVTASVTYNRSYCTEDDYTIVYMSNYRKSEYNIPSSINYNGYDYTVTSIEEGAFADQVKYKSTNTISYYNNLLSPIKHVTIPNSITHIGAYAFYNRYLDECNLPNVEIIDEYAFACNSNFNTITAPNLKQIGDYAFDDNRQLTELFFPNLETVGNYAFKDCRGITKISMPQLKEIGESSFRGCTNLSNVSFPRLEVIEDNAFSSCHGLTSVIFPETLTIMGENVFSNCSLLRELFYLSHTPPINWVATTMTYVPDMQAYSSPETIINNGEVIELITFSSNSLDYSGLSPATKWVNNVSGYDATLSLSGTNKNVGSHEEWIPVTFTKGEESFVCDVIYRYNVNPINLTIHANNLSREYGEDNPVLSLSYSGFENGETESVFTTPPTVSTTATKTSDVGEYPITISGGESQNYTFVYEPGVLTITKAPLTAQVNNATRQYGRDNPAFTISYTGLKNGEKIPKWKEALKIETAATKTSDVGIYDVTASGIPTNYSLSAIDKGILSITQAPLTIKAENANRMYFEAEPSFKYSCSGFLNNDNVDALTKVPLFTTDATLTSNAGKYLITPSAAEAMNYAISYEQGELTITKRRLKATSHCSRFYGEENPLLPIEYSGFVNGETEEVLSVKPLGTTNATKTSSVGEYPITVSGGEATNYDFVYKQGVLTVTKASLSAKVKDLTKVYGTQNPPFSIEYYGLKNGETVPAWTTAPTFQTEANKVSGVGQYTIKAINGVSANYNIEIADGTLSITPAQLTIKANDATRQYYSDNPAFSYKYNGFVNEDDESVLISTPTLSTSATRDSNVGTYEIRIGEASCSNYSISYINGTLTITPCMLTASVGNYERTYNEENPVFEVKYNGFVGDEDENVLISKPEANTTATKTSDVGTYPISVTGGSADNYTFSYTSGTLTINKAEQTISWTQDLSGLKIGDQVELKAVASSGLPITYTMDNNSAAEIYTTGKRWYLDCKENGNFLIRAVQNGNENYYSSPRVSNRVTISDNPPTPDPSQVPASISATIGTSGIATLYCIYALNFSTIAGIRAYIVSSFTPATGSVVLTRVKGDVPARTGLILIGDEGSYNIPTGESKTLVSNMLNGTAEAMVLEKVSGDYTNFILATKDGDTGFYAVKDGTTLAAGRAYLPLPTALLPQDNASRGLMMTFDERGDATAIHSTVSLPNSQQVYSLSGQRVNPNSLSRGLYIVGGKKVVIGK